MVCMMAHNCVADPVALPAAAAVLTCPATQRLCLHLAARPRRSLGSDAPRACALLRQLWDPTRELWCPWNLQVPRVQAQKLWSADVSCVKYSSGALHSTLHAGHAGIIEHSAAMMHASLLKPVLIPVMIAPLGCSGSNLGGMKAMGPT